MTALDRLIHITRLEALSEHAPLWKLPDIACELLIEGKDTKHLVQLAGENGTTDVFVLRELLGEVAHELALKVPTRLEAAEALKLEAARAVLAGEITPREGAARIVDLFRQIEDEVPKGHFVGEGFGIARIFGLDDGYWDLPSLPVDVRDKEERELDRAMVVACEGVLGVGVD